MLVRRQAVAIISEQVGVTSLQRHLSVQYIMCLVKFLFYNSSPSGALLFGLLMMRRWTDEIIVD